MAAGDDARGGSAWAAGGQGSASGVARAGDRAGGSLRTGLWDGLGTGPGDGLQAFDQCLGSPAAGIMQKGCQDALPAHPQSQRGKTGLLGRHGEGVVRSRKTQP